MIDYGKQRSTVKPDELELTETKVFVSSNITEVNEPETDEYSGFTGYEFDLIEYSKDEYIKIQAEKNATLEDEITQAQVAMCEIYEMIGQKEGVRYGKDLCGTNYQGVKTMDDVPDKLKDAVKAILEGGN